MKGSFFSLGRGTLGGDRNRNNQKYNAAERMKGCRAKSCYYRVLSTPLALHAATGWPVVTAVVVTSLASLFRGLVHAS